MSPVTILSFDFPAKAQGALGAGWDAFWVAAAGVADYCFVAAGMKCYGAVFAGFDAPVAAFAFLFINNYCACFFGLSYGFFGASM